MAVTANSIAPTFAGRLACASNCAYAVSTVDGKYVAPSVYDAGVGWQSTPVAVAARKEGLPIGPYINACLVGRNVDGIVVAFRGTVPPALTVASFEDWWQDIVDSAPSSHSPLPGKVHSGFWSALETIWPGLLSALEIELSKSPGTSVYVTGHSKGGPLATLAAARMLLESRTVAKSVTTFASPHPGDTTFVRSYPDEIPVSRFENYLDIVPFIAPTDAFFRFFHDTLPAWMQDEFCRLLPNLCKSLRAASQWNYASLGELEYVTDVGEVVGAQDFRADTLYRLGQIIGELFGIDQPAAGDVSFRAVAPTTALDSGFRRIGAAHCISCKADGTPKFCAGGYMTGSGAGVLCPAPD